MNDYQATAVKDMPFADNKRESRYEIKLDNGQTAKLNYMSNRNGDVVMLTHTEVPYAYEGQGIGSRLVEKAFEDLKKQGKKVIPSCSFVAGYICKNPKWSGIVAERY